jgi:hypothetical protein
MECIFIGYYIHLARTCMYVRAHTHPHTCAHAHTNKHSHTPTHTHTFPSHVVKVCVYVSDVCVRGSIRTRVLVSTSMLEVVVSVSVPVVVSVSVPVVVSAVSSWSLDRKASSCGYRSASESEIYMHKQ